MERDTELLNDIVKQVTAIKTILAVTYKWILIIIPMLIIYGAYMFNTEYNTQMQTNANTYQIKANTEDISEIQKKLDNKAINYGR